MPLYRRGKDDNLIHRMAIYPWKDIVNSRTVLLGDRKYAGAAVAIRDREVAFWVQRCEDRTFRIED